MDSIPAEVAKAIVTVMSGIKTLGKDDSNKFQKYDFVSVDKFLAAVGPLCAAARLVILQEEESVDVSTKESTDDYGKTKTSAWLSVKYAFTFVHASGAAYGPMHRSVMVPANGAQAFGSAQSYALKQFERSVFQIPTGDKDDADQHQAELLPSKNPYPKKPVMAEEKKPIGSGTEFKPPEPAQVPVPINAEGTGSDWPSWAKYLLPHRLRECKTADEVQEVVDANRDSLESLKTVSAAAHAGLQKLYTSMIDGLAGKS